MPSVEDYFGSTPNAAVVSALLVSVDPTIRDVQKFGRAERQQYPARFGWARLMLIDCLLTSGPGCAAARA
jgi:hypothetical protein